MQCKSFMLVARFQLGERTVNRDRKTIVLYSHDQSSRGEEDRRKEIEIYDTCKLYKKK